MREIEDLQKCWDGSARFRGIEAGLCLGKDALTLGAGTVLAKRSDDGALELDGEEARILTLLSVAQGGPVDPAVLGSLRRASRHASAGDECMAAMHVALAGLAPPGDPREAARRLFVADGLIAAGVAPRDIWTALEFDPAPLDALEKYDTSEPRVPAGSGRPSGEWTNGSAAAAAAAAASAVADWGGRAAAPEIRAEVVRLLSRLTSLRTIAAAALRDAPYSAFAATLLDPSSADGKPIEGSVRDFPDLKYSHYPSETGLRIIDTSSGTTILNLGWAGIGRYSDRSSGIVAHVENGELVIGPPMPDSQSRTSDRSQAGSVAQVQTKALDVCPEPPGPDLPGMIGARGLRSKAYENYMKLKLNPDFPTPPGFGYQLVDPLDDKPVYYDDCQHVSGSMAEYKGVGYARLINWAERAKRLNVLATLGNRWVRQATRQIDASEGRPVVWFFAEQGALGLAHSAFLSSGDPRLAGVVLRLEPPPGVRAWWRDYISKLRRRGLPNPPLRKANLSQMLAVGDGGQTSGKSV